MIAVFLLAVALEVESFQPISSRSKCITKPSQQQHQYLYQQQYSSTKFNMSTENSNEKTNNLPMLLDPGTKGGALFLSLVLFIIPIIGYEVVTLGFGVDGVEAGKWIGVGFTLFTTVLWVSTYIFRVATKDMTYVSFFDMRFLSCWRKRKDLLTQSFD